MGDWSSGMIPALGAGGRGFNSRISSFYQNSETATNVLSGYWVVLYIYYQKATLGEISHRKSVIEINYAKLMKSPKIILLATG